MNKNVFLLSTAVVAALSSAAYAEENDIFSSIPGAISGTVSIVSDYSFRGITQSDENPAIQGSLDYNLDFGNNVGFYAGVWGSNVDFNDGDEASTEFDYYGGFTYAIDKLSFDVGAIYYNYPGADENLNYDYTEIKASVGYDFTVLQTEAAVYYSPENFGDSGDAQYYVLSAEVPLPKGFTLDAHVGRQYVQDNATFGNPDYTDWSVGLGYNIKGLDVHVQYVDTDLSKTDCADGCDAKAIVTVSKSF